MLNFNNLLKFIPEKSCYLSYSVNYSNNKKDISTKKRILLQLISVLLILELLHLRITVVRKCFFR